MSTLNLILYTAAASVFAITVIVAVVATARAKRAETKLRAWNELYVGHDAWAPLAITPCPDCGNHNADVLGHQSCPRCGTLFAPDITPEDVESFMQLWHAEFATQDTHESQPAEMECET